jgi:hypothetical protein
MTRRWCCLWLIAMTVTVGAQQNRGAAERPTLVGLDAAGVESLIGPPREKNDLADSNEAYWTYKTAAGTLTLHLQNSVVVDVDPADFPVERILRSTIAAPASSRPTAWTAFVERFLAEQDHVGDLSAASFGDDLVRTRAELAELRAMDASRLAADDAIDRRFVETLLARREIEQAQMRRWRMDPRIYMQSLVAIADRLEDEDDDSSAAAVEVLRLLKTLPQDLRFGRHNLTLSVPAFQTFALALASAGATSLTTGVTAFAERVPDQKDAILAANTVARAALNEWTDYLSKELPKRPTGYTAVGIETYAAILRDQYLLQDGADQLYELIRQEFERTQQQLRDVAAEIDDTRPWLSVAADAGGNAVDDIDADTVAALYRTAGETARTDLDEARLVAVPWTASLDDWRFTPGDSAGETLFGTLDPAVVSIHAHAEYGDRVRALYQMHNASAVRRERRALTYTAGWRLYVEHLLEEFELMPDEHATLRLLQLRLLAIVRAAADLGIHTHRMTEAQALAFLTERTGVTKAAAEREIAAIVDDPGSGLGYLGWSEIAKLRDDLKKARGGAFSLADFHERLLKAGPLPPALVRAALLP